MPSAARPSVGAPNTSRRLRGGRHHIRRAELTARATKLTRVNDQAIRCVLEAAGVEFIDADGGGPGVPLRKAQQSES